MTDGGRGARTGGYGCHLTQWFPTGAVLWAEARDAIRQSTEHRTNPTTKNYLVQNVHSADTEER